MISLGFDIWHLLLLAIQHLTAHESHHNIYCLWAASDFVNHRHHNFTVFSLNSHFQNEWCKITSSDWTVMTDSKNSWMEWHSPLSLHIHSCTIPSLREPWGVWSAVWWLHDRNESTITTKKNNPKCGKWPWGRWKWLHIHRMSKQVWKQRVSHLMTDLF